MGIGQSTCVIIVCTLAAAAPTTKSSSNPAGHSPSPPPATSNGPPPQAGRTPPNPTATPPNTGSRLWAGSCGPGDRLQLSRSARRPDRGRQVAEDQVQSVPAGGTGHLAAVQHDPGPAAYLRCA